MCCVDVCQKNHYKCHACHNKFRSGSLSLVPNNADDPKLRGATADTVMQLLLLLVSNSTAAMYAMAAAQQHPAAMQDMQQLQHSSNDKQQCKIRRLPADLQLAQLCLHLLLRPLHASSHGVQAGLQALSRAARHCSSATVQPVLGDAQHRVQLMQQRGGDGAGTPMGLQLHQLTVRGLAAACTKRQRSPFCSFLDVAFLACACCLLTIVFEVCVTCRGLMTCLQQSMAAGYDTEQVVSTT